MNPGLARFTQPDTIIPTLAYPQTLNRYSYVGNNPINYIDPSGNYACASDDDCDLDDADLNLEMERIAITADTTEENYIDKELKKFGVNAKGKWKLADKRKILAGVKATGEALAEASFAKTSGLCGVVCNDVVISAKEAFTSAFGRITIELAAGNSAEMVEGTIYGGCGRTWKTGFVCVNKSGAAGLELTVVHELGHVFNAKQGYVPYGDTSAGVKRRGANCEKKNYGFASPCYGDYSGWQQSKRTGHEEEFADMFLGWVYNQWDLSNAMGRQRSTFMQTNMPVWID